MSRDRILLIDDDKLILKAVETALQRENIQVTTTLSGVEGLKLAKTNRYDVIILDLLIPDTDGFELIRVLRNTEIYTPIIIISGKEEEHNKILGLGLGADDYLTKPFSIHLLISKIKAFVRRSKIYKKNNISELNLGPFRFEEASFKFYKNNEAIELTSKETMLLKFFLENPNRVFTKEQLYQTVWNETIIDDNTIMVYIKRLRNKIEENPKEPQYLKTVWGIGYQFNL